MNARGLWLLGCFLLSNAWAYSENWPQFRGPTGQGVSTETEIPTEWNATNNVVWKTEVPGESWSSPICWGERVFLTTATESGVSCHLLALDRVTGRLIWDKQLSRQNVAGRKEGRNSYATPTPATDGERVYAVFFDGSFLAVDFQGHLVWVNRDYPFYSQHGLGTSPILWGDLVIMARDGSSEGENKKLGWQEPWDKSFVLALDRRTGKERWKTGRGLSRIAHVVPVIWTNQEGRSFVISGAGDVVQGFDAASGERIWTSLNRGEGVVPSLAVGDGLAFTACGFSGRDSIRAFRLGGRGDLKETNLAWEQRKAMPRVPSLLYVYPHLFSVSDTGQALCLKGATGEILWQQNLGGTFSASPVYADGKVYFLSDAGETTVVEAAPQFKIIHRNPLGEKCQASMAVSHHHLFIRTERNLFCIGDKQR
jgi:outer membrane protein assembly factor BamB